jgi:hypothetical protein
MLLVNNIVTCPTAPFKTYKNGKNTIRDDLKCFKVRIVC